ncbi:sir2 family histone deacetylase [Grosmannia clavigera kw1407]|uniref:Sir2 family histone deacetylase n=1 Tax=Grosmannia clavigera (strain kw1407 / UAMH 11150) TaxID=655863 RepID=F0XAD7_GROCL|nr:sir2 family histone deacetylase [Grosmannia clavigera kw1407]EFX05231.1 sir2 family histone deacetylase [Grosmannia clavigera kw1407]
MVLRKPLLRIPFTDVLPAPHILPRHATTPAAAVAALGAFLTAPPPPGLPQATVAITGAGLSVASGLADYRGANGTYRVNKTYRAIYHHEFIASHEARKRYWARSFLGWSTLRKAAPNAAHYAVRDLGRLGYLHAVVTQNVDSFHRLAHSQRPATVELHGYLRATVCTSCFREFSRDAFQDDLARLNPVWAAFLVEAIASGALQPDKAEQADSSHSSRSSRVFRSIRSNPDGDVDVPGAPYTTFRYPACPHCLAQPPMAKDGSRQAVEVGNDGAWMPPRSGGRGAGILKPAVVMFGENIAPAVKHAAEAAVDQAGRLLVLATSLATYSAWRLAKRARDRGMPIAIVNMGGVRGEEAFFDSVGLDQDGSQGVRVEMSTDSLLPMLVDELQRTARKNSPAASEDDGRGADCSDPALFRDMLS